MDLLVRPPAPAALLQTRVVAVLRAKGAREYPPVIDALVAGGVRAIELTLTTEGVFESFADLHSRWDADVSLGIGSVTDLDSCREAIAVGAEFVVTPTMTPAIIRECVRAGVPVVPGGLTPTEIAEGWQAGATAVKIFPAVTVGPAFLSQLRGPFPDLQVMPSGGVELDDIPAWLDAGAVAVSLGGQLVGDAFSGGDLTALTARGRRAISLATEAVAAR